jgi:hypothetical protein
MEQQLTDEAPSDAPETPDREYSSIADWRAAKEDDRKAFEEFTTEKKRKAEEPPHIDTPMEAGEAIAAHDDDFHSQLIERLANVKTEEESAEINAAISDSLHAKNEQRRIAHDTRIQELAVQQQQAQAHLQMSQNRAALLATQLSSQIQEKYGDIALEDLNRMSQENPQLAQSYLADIAIARFTLDQETAQQLQQQQEMARATHGWGVEQDQKLRKQLHLDHPEAFGADHKIKREYQDAARSYLSSVGFAPGEFEHLQSQVPALLDHRLQRLLFDGGQLWKAKQAARNATKRPLPPVLRPGVQTVRVGRDEAAIARLTSKSGLTLKEAAQLSMLRRGRD